MKHPAVHFQIPLEALSAFFESTNKQEHVLARLHGQGCMQLHNIEKGLTASTWDFCLTQTANLPGVMQAPQNDLTLLFFPDTVGLHLYLNNCVLNKNHSWNIALTNAAELQLCLFPEIRYRFLSIHFTQDWLCENVGSAGAFPGWREKFCNKSVRRLLLDAANEHEKNLLQEVFKRSCTRPLGALSMKSLVLKLTGDFFVRIVETPPAKAWSQDDLVSRIEQVVAESTDFSIPSLKKLAFAFSISESSLQRQFRKSYGENISAFFFRRKMQYAKFLIEEGQYPLKEAAQAVGYRSFYCFLSKYKQYCAASHSKNLVPIVR